MVKFLFAQLVKNAENCSDLINIIVESLNKMKMKTSNEEMKHLLAGLQQLQREDKFAHNMTIEARKDCDGDAYIVATFTSVIEKDDEDSPMYIRSAFYSSKSLRINNA